MNTPTARYVRLARKYGWKSKEPHHMDAPQVPSHDWFLASQPIVYKNLPGHDAPGPALSHCRAWWPITALPVRCGACGGVALEEQR